MSAAPTRQSLLDANEAFYRVFETLDYAAMEALWEKSERVFCVHPGWQPLWGEKAVLDSWRRIIENTSAMRFTLTVVEARVAGEVGIVTVFEHIMGEHGQERYASGAVSTNLFGWDGQGWRIFHHHASPAPLPAADMPGTLN